MCGGEVVQLASTWCCLITLAPLFGVKHIRSIYICIISVYHPPMVTHCHLTSHGHPLSLYLPLSPIVTLPPIVTHCHLTSHGHPLSLYLQWSPIVTLPSMVTHCHLTSHGHPLTSYLPWSPIVTLPPIVTSPVVIYGHLPLPQTSTEEPLDLSPFSCQNISISFALVSFLYSTAPAYSSPLVVQVPPGMCGQQFYGLCNRKWSSDIC